MSATWYGLIEALADIPRLEHARCKAKAETWESDDPDVVEFAINQCQSCPALNDCAEWLSTLHPSRRAPGVVAAQPPPPAAADLRRGRPPSAEESAAAAAQWLAEYLGVNGPSPAKAVEAAAVAAGITPTALRRGRKVAGVVSSRGHHTAMLSLPADADTDSARLGRAVADERPWGSQRDHPPEYTKLPRVIHSDSGVWLEHVGLLDGDDAARLVSWLASAVKNTPREGRVPVVTVIDNGVEVAGLGRLDHAAALALAHRLADCLSP